MITIKESPIELYPYQSLINKYGNDFLKSNVIDTRNLTYHSLVNTNCFREEAIRFVKYGYYTDAPEGSLEYDEYWDIQEERCLNGYQVGDLWITGRHYFYLNFFPMVKVTVNPPDRVLGFPDFWEIDYAWWITKHISKRLGCNLAVLKTRRAGFSFKEAADCVYNYNFIANSKSYIYAQNEVFLVGERIMDKVKEGLDHLNAHTIWYKNRHFKDTSLHYKASYREGNIEKGYKSEIIAQALDKPNKARGGAAFKVTFEEAGSFKNLLSAWQICDAQVREGGVVVGQLTAFGTGGDMGDGLIEKYHILPFNNIWDDGMEGSSCGFFTPCLWTFTSAMSENGIVDVQKAKEYYDSERRVKGGGNDTSALDKYVAEFPYTPREALMRLNGNIFPSVLCSNQEFFVNSNKDIQASILYGELKKVREDERDIVKFYPNKTVKDAMLKYPIEKGTMADGAVVLYQTPYDAENMYYVVCDPYMNDEAPESASVGAAFVYKRASASFIDRDRPADCIVASYVARPEKGLNEFIKTVFYLCEYYKAKLYFESAGGGQSIRDYARNNNLMHYLAFQPAHLLNKEVVSYKNRSYGINITDDVKRTYLRAFADWLIRERELTENGYVLNLNLIYDVGLLKELSKYNENGNFDRVSACILIAILIEDVSTQDIVSGEKTNLLKFFDKPIFTNKPNNQSNRYI
jgi:hypothetical protein